MAARYSIKTFTLGERPLHCTYLDKREELLEDCEEPLFNNKYNRLLPKEKEPHTDISYTRKPKTQNIKLASTNRRNHIPI